MSKIKAFVQIALGPTLPWGVRNVYLGSGLWYETKYYCVGIL